MTRLLVGWIAADTATDATERTAELAAELLEGVDFGFQLGDPVVDGIEFAHIGFRIEVVQFGQRLPKLADLRAKSAFGRPNGVVERLQFVFEVGQLRIEFAQLRVDAVECCLGGVDRAADVTDLLEGVIEVRIETLDCLGRLLGSLLGTGCGVECFFRLRLRPHRPYRSRCRPSAKAW